MKRIVLALPLLLGACAQSLPDLPQGTQAYANFSSTPDSAVRDYRIGAFDTIAVTVFQEPDLTAKDVQVDAAGMVLLPLIGSSTIPAASTWTSLAVRSGSWKTVTAIVSNAPIR